MYSYGRVESVTLLSYGFTRSRALVLMEIIDWPQSRGGLCEKEQKHGRN